MAQYKLGLDCVLTIGGTQIKDAKDVTLNIERGDAVVTTRNANGWRAHMGTLKDASIEFEILTGGDSFAGLLSMFTGRTSASARRRRDIQAETQQTTGMIHMLSKSPPGMRHWWEIHPKIDRPSWNESESVPNRA